MRFAASTIALIVIIFFKFNLIFPIPIQPENPKYSINIVDGFGRNVTISIQPDRVVSRAPVHTEMRRLAMELI